MYTTKTKTKCSQGGFPLTCYFQIQKFHFPKGDESLWTLFLKVRHDIIHFFDILIFVHSHHSLFFSILILIISLETCLVAAFWFIKEMFFACIHTGLLISPNKLSGINFKRQLSSDVCLADSQLDLNKTKSFFLKVNFRKDHTQTCHLHQLKR